MWWKKLIFLIYFVQLKQIVYRTLNGFKLTPKYYLSVLSFKVFMTNVSFNLTWKQHWIASEILNSVNSALSPRTRLRQDPQQISPYARSMSGPLMDEIQKYVYFHTFTARGCQCAVFWGRRTEMSVYCIKNPVARDVALVSLTLGLVWVTI